MPSKRTHYGEGSITQQSNGKYRVRIELDPVDGKRKWLSAVAQTITEARQKLKELQRQKEDNVLQLRAAEDTIMYQAEIYKRHLLATGRAEGSVLLVMCAIRQLADITKDIHLSKLTSQHIDALLLNWKRQHYKTSTIRSKGNTLKAFLQWCVENELLVKNPMIRFHGKTQKVKPKQNLIVLSKVEHEKIKSYLYQYWLQKEGKKLIIYRMYCLYCLEYESGIRVGEIAALTWDNVNFKDNTITIAATVSITLDRKQVVAPVLKTAAAYRTIKISDKTMLLMKELKDLTGAMSDFVFYNYRSHSFFNENTLNFRFRAILKAVGIARHLTFHDLRHTNASNMIYQNVPIAVITKRLGHADIGVTYSIYGHIIQECKEAQIAVIEA